MWRGWIALLLLRGSHLRKSSSLVQGSTSLENIGSRTDSWGSDECQHGAMRVFLDSRPQRFCVQPFLVLLAATCGIAGPFYFVPHSFSNCRPGLDAHSATPLVWGRPAFSLPCTRWTDAHRCEDECIENEQAHGFLKDPQSSRMLEGVDP